MPTKIVLITGSSSGFGMLTAARLAAAGHTVYATMRDLSRKEPLLKDYARRGEKGSLHILPMDVTDVQGVTVTINKILSEAGHIDVLINNAGYGIGGFFEDLSDQDIRAQFETNFFGVLNVTRAVLPSMRERRQGRIINVSSMTAFSGTPAFSAYVSSKWAVEGFSESLAIELLPFGVEVIVVEPGAYKTKIFFENARHALRFHDKASPYYEYNQHLQGLVKNQMSKSERDPEEVAATLHSLVESQRPSFRNIIGWRSKIRAMIVRHIPFSWYAGLVTSILLKKGKNPDA